jgi:hypothetical protein
MLAERLGEATDFDVKVPPPPTSRPQSTPKPRPRAKKDDDGVVGDILRSPEGRTLRREIVRGLMGLLRRSMR